MNDQPTTRLSPVLAAWANCSSDHQVQCGIPRITTARSKESPNCIPRFTPCFPKSFSTVKTHPISQLENNSSTLPHRARRTAKRERERRGRERKKERKKGGKRREKKTPQKKKTKDPRTLTQKDKCHCARQGTNYLPHLPSSNSSNGGRDEEGEEGGD